MADEADTPTGAETQDPAPTDGAPESGAAKFTQDQVNRLIEQRLARQEKALEKRLADATESAIATFREEHGLDDETLGKVAKVDEAALKLKRELATERAAKTRLEKEMAEREERFKTLDSRLRHILVDEALAREAAPKAAGGDVEPILALLRGRMRVDDSTLTAYVADESGEPSSMSVTELVDDLLTRKPQLAAATGRYGSGSPPHQPGNRRPDSEADTPERRMALLQKAFGG